MVTTLTWTRLLSGFGIAAGLMAASLAHAAAPTPSRFSVSADGQEVTDSQTKLVWQRCPIGSKWDGKLCAGKPTKFTLLDAKRASDPSNAGWRLPNKEEFAALADRSKKKPQMDALAFPPKPKGLHWALRSDTDDNLNAWLVDYRSGKVFGNTSDARHFVRLVRPG